MLVAAEEFQCCKEIEGCLDSLQSKRVLEDVNVEGQILECITEHPGFAPICLSKWPLLHCAAKYKSRKHKRKYCQTGTENELVSFTFTLLILGHKLASPDLRHPKS